MSVSKGSVGIGLWIVCVGVGFLIPFVLQAASYDVYVEASADLDEADGSRKYPYSSIGEAIAAVSGLSGSQKIFVGAGVYEEDVVVEKSVEFYGEKKSKTVIVGTMTLKDDVLLQNLTIKASRTVGILVSEDASAKLENCEIVGSKKMGIQALPGKGKLTLKQVTVRGGGGKGLYIQEGKTIDIRDSEVTDNAEEGIDIRAKVSGVIANNSIHENGESGIELVIGSSDLLIANNAIQKNSASGIAAQFYAETSKRGSINIEGNTIQDNRKYGLDCALPSGGSPNASYWNRSIDLQKNTFDDNRIDAINDFCDIINVVEEEEEELDNRIENESESDEEISKSQSQKVSRVELEQKVKEAQEVRERDEILWTEAYGLVEEHAASVSRANAQLVAINKKSRWQVFLFGVDEERMAELRKEIERSETRLAHLRELTNQMGNEESRTLLEASAEAARADIASWKNFVAQKKEDGLLGGVIRWWRGFIEGKL
jgi:hypothetical protein